ncbi:MAG TPA: hypothetical protein PLH57_07415 [Oligoflexia bacterium]|nr:hypothetical protein [Oligoflexia bacterium]
MSESKVDPLYIIFEKHLYDFHEEEENSKEFIDNIIKDYLNHLTSRNVAVPQQWHGVVVEELREQVRNMLVKKTYGCLSISEFIKKEVAKKDQAKTKKLRVGRK